MCSSGDERVFKVRKPYTRTKQREKWTQDDHDKFLEALKLYGRAWRRIEEHIGTKTAVQIRSHAQKFFSKVVKDPESDDAVSIKIPPPRPKRKPSRPYPRKLDHSSTRDVIPPAAKSPPSSVLCSSPIFSQQSCCTSPDSSINPLCQLGTSSTEPEDGSQSEHPPSIDIGLQETESAMETDLSTQENPRSESLKLFGRTVLVADPQNPLPCAAEVSTDRHNMSQQDTFANHQADPQNPLPCAAEVSTDRHNMSQQDTFANHQEDAGHVRVEPRDGPRTRSFGIPCQDRWNPWPCGFLPLLFFAPMNLGCITETTVAPLPWWAFCGAPYPLIPSYIPGRPQESTQVQEEMQQERSCVGSASDGATTTCNERLPEEEEITNRAAGAQLDPGARTATVPTLGGRRSGFVPYRCFLGQSTMTANDESGYRRVELRL